MTVFENKWNHDPIATEKFSHKSYRWILLARLSLKYDQKKIKNKKNAAALVALIFFPVLVQ